MDDIPPDVAKKLLNRDFRQSRQTSAGGRKDQPLRAG